MSSPHLSESREHPEQKNCFDSLWRCRNVDSQSKSVTDLPPLRKLSSDQVPGRSNSIPVPVVIIPSSPIMGRPEDICLSENCQQGRPTIILTTCSPAESPARSPLPNLPTTPPS